MPGFAASDARGESTYENPALSNRLIVASEIRLSEIISALSVALDITQGNPKGHCMRSAIIGMRLAEQLRLSTADRSALFYALLLKDLGCSSNAAKMAYLFAADDLVVKRSLRMINWNRPGECLTNCWAQCAAGGSLYEKLLQMAVILRSGAKGARKIAEIRCERGADIARMLQLPEATAGAIYELDEHWDGEGNPCGLKGEEISLLGRICCVAQTVEVFYSAYGYQAALNVAVERRSSWFDPQLVDALVALKQDASFWNSLASDDLLVELGHWEPDDAVLLADEECLDRVAEAFAKVVDAKSPWTFQHSTRVAQISVGIAEQFQCAPELVRDLRRAALLHDIGKLGVSNLILDKAGKPTPDELAQIRRHPEYTLQILEQVDAFRTLADVAGAHHERLDGNGYHRQLTGYQIPWAARVLTVADIAEAMSAQRPYREALPWPKIQQIMAADAGAGVDADCLHALECWQDRNHLESRVEAQLHEVELLASGF
ncbi:MAG TPA: HD domain-containing phosphohydrolase [Pirellulales bacterium]|jgi:putative nucleotidyltransferase with HDIG domain|nr:HD domain-containing phosphohydrolase [Pirellulales bacterium]